MSERKTAREVACSCGEAPGWAHDAECDARTAAIESRDQEATDRLAIAVEALEKAHADFDALMLKAVGDSGMYLAIDAKKRVRDALNRLRSPTAATPAPRCGTCGGKGWVMCGCGQGQCIPQAVTKPCPDCQPSPERKP